ncbi:hypothetical protein FACS189429_0200 [Bacteroidia bacterium]|nr:hypothetical protein FACS189429_0200 [Bacteroidia bacterium]
MTLKLRWFRFYSFLLTRLPAVFGARFRRNHHEQIKQAVTVRFFAKNYVPKIPQFNSQTSREMPETLWQYWAQGADSAPELVQACFRTAEKFSGERKHIIIDNKTLSHYADLPAYIHDRFRAGEISYAHFSDLVRMELLYRHGGYWLDATNYMTDEIPQWIDALDFFVFHDRTVGYPYSFMQNCFIRSVKGAFLLEAWRAMCFEYWKNENKNLDYFQHQLMFKAMIENSAKAKKCYAQMPNIDQEPTHRFAKEKLYSEFDAEEFKRLTADAFFQKLSHHNVPANVSANTNYAHLIKMA